MKAYLYSAGLLLTVGLIGCDPKTTTVTGQVFIVTRGVENVKLGAVDVLLIETSQVKSFLERKQPAIEVLIASRQQAFAAAQDAARNAEAAFNLFLTNGLPVTNEGFVKTESQIDEGNKELEVLSREFSAIDLRLQSQQKAPITAENVGKEADLLAQEDANLKRSKQKVAEVKVLLAKLKSVVTRGKEEETNKFLTAKALVETARGDFENSPTVGDYFGDFSPAVTQKTVTDADGKFAFTFSRDKARTIFVITRREVLSKTEHYCWLVDAPTNAETAQAILSNNNLVFVDPDGYFKLKPKKLP